MDYEDIKVGERYKSAYDKTVTALAKAHGMVFADDGDRAFTVNDITYSHWKPLPKEHKREVWAVLFSRAGDETISQSSWGIKDTALFHAQQLKQEGYTILAVKRIPFTAIEGEFDE